MSSHRWSSAPIWRSPITIALAGAFVIAAATSNWAIHNIGQFNGPDAPRTLPIGWGLEAPSGVVLVGVMIAVRDALHEQVGIKGTLVVILMGSVISALLAPPALAVASGATMVTAEVADALVYERLRQRGRLIAAAASNFVSATIDSAMFLLIAFGLTVHASRPTR
jgi:uncharacterized PurR-regulated membrane protein YhhQ (DUF165 family)